MFAAAVRRWGRPAVEIEVEGVHQLLDVGKDEPGEEHLFLVGDTVSVGVAQVNDVGRHGDNDATAPREDPHGKTEALGEKRGLFVAAVPVGILQQANGARTDLPGADALVGVASHLGDIHPPRFIESGTNRINHIWFTGHEFGHKAVLQLERGSGLARGQRTDRRGEEILGRCQGCCQK